jgi:hypothetical protein
MTDWKYDTLEALERWVAWKYMTETLSWTGEKIALELDLNLERLLKWVNAGAHTMNRIMDQQQGKVKAILRTLMETYPSSVVSPDALPDIDLKKVVEFLNAQVYDMDKMAKILKVNPEVFRIWYGKHLPEINAALKQAHKRGEFSLK